MVAIQHCTESVSTPYLRWSIEVFRPGEWGVIIFFVSSGFIIPSSLERYRSVGRFWIGRFFRLYPLYWAVTGGALALYFVDRYALDPLYKLHWVRGTAANVTMAQEFIGQPHVLGQAWTLSYELVFYGLVSLLFLVGLDRRPGLVLSGGLVTALVVGTAVPARMITGGVVDQQLVVAAIALAAAAAAAAFAGGSAGRRLTAAGLAVVIVALVANRAHPAWFSTLLLSSMFVGWVLHRWATGRAPWTHAVAAVGGTSAAVIVGHLLYFQINYVPGTDIHTSAVAETLTFLGAYAAFCGALALRHRAFPKVLRWLGEISYSVYLVHGVVLQAVPRVGGPVMTVLVWLAVTIAASWVTYRLFERPFQEWGRTLARRVASSPR
jgi:peptidoglycan/LPS O-acetylase OafA/YrhL